MIALETGLQSDASGVRFRIALRNLALARLGPDCLRFVPLCSALSASHHTGRIGDRALHELVQRCLRGDTRAPSAPASPALDSLPGTPPRSGPATPTAALHGMAAVGRLARDSPGAADASGGSGARRARRMLFAGDMMPSPPMVAAPAPAVASIPMTAQSQGGLLARRTVLRAASAAAAAAAAVLSPAMGSPAAGVVPGFMRSPGADRTGSP
jgi:hypothetical protein